MSMQLATTKSSHKIATDNIHVRILNCIHVHIVFFSFTVDDIAN